MTEKQINRILRRRFSGAGWTLLIYYGIMNIMVILTMFLQGLGAALDAFRMGQIPDVEKIAAMIAGNAWGYLWAALVGLVILVAWKGLPFLGKELWHSEKRMEPTSFLAILCVFSGSQLVFSLLTEILDLLLRPLGVDITASVTAATAQDSSVSMLLYASLVAPLTEEILFRGLIRRMFRPYGKRFSIFVSAFCFGVFHGNLVQTPYAFVVGLILGYVAEEYSLGWCVLLHAFNNLVLGVLLTELSGLLPGNLGALLQSAIMLAFALGALAVLLTHTHEIREYRQADRMDGRCVSCFFTNSGTILFMILFAVNMVLMLTL